MHHDPHIRAAADAADPAANGWVSRFSRFFGRGAEPSPEAFDAPPPEHPSPSPWPTAGRGDDAPALENLATMLAELIATAESRIEGAAHIVGRSAEEARAYGQALVSEAAGLDRADPVAAALIAVTRSMIEHTRGAEARLRTMGAELDTLNRDLADARTSAERDQLTGLPNRRALEATLAHAVNATRAADRALSLAFCDIDHFKRVNDTHGHALGDRVLRLVADALSENVGDEVFVGRQGGEEFVMLFDGVGLEEAAAQVDTIRERLAGREFKSRTNNVPVGAITFSAGVAELRAGEAGEDLLRRADAALYRAKDGGRNRVEADREEAGMAADDADPPA